MASQQNLPVPPGFPAMPNMGNTAQIAEQVRLAAHAEAERAAQLFGAQARSATRTLSPIISDYTNKFIRLFKQVVVIGVLLMVAWFVFQAWANMSLFEWIGDRIDNLSDENTVGLVSGWRDPCQA